MATTCFGREIGTVEVRPEYACAKFLTSTQRKQVRHWLALRAREGKLSKISAGIQECQVLLMPRNRRRGQQARRAMPRMGKTDGAKRFLRPIHEIRARAAVDVQIDIARREVAALQVDVIHVVRL